MHDIARGVKGDFRSNSRNSGDDPAERRPKERQSSGKITIGGRAFPVASKMKRDLKNQSGRIAKESASGGGTRGGGEDRSHNETGRNTYSPSFIRRCDESGVIFREGGILRILVNPKKFPHPRRIRTRTREDFE